MAMRGRGASRRVDDLHGKERFPRNIRELTLEDGRSCRRWITRWAFRSRRYRRRAKKEKGSSGQKAYRH
jgi:hypothetical protein